MWKFQPDILFAKTDTQMDIFSFLRRFIILENKILG